MREKYFLWNINPNDDGINSETNPYSIYDTTNFGAFEFEQECRNPALEKVLPDGCIDGWGYNFTRDEWGNFNETSDNLHNFWEDEDLDLDGTVDTGSWSDGSGPGETNASTWDTDSDEMPDGWEAWYRINPLSTSGNDGSNGTCDDMYDYRAPWDFTSGAPVNEYVPNRIEYIAGSNPIRKDSFRSHVTVTIEDKINGIKSYQVFSSTRTDGPIKDVRVKPLSNGKQPERVAISFDVTYKANAWIKSPTITVIARDNASVEAYMSQRIVTGILDFKRDILKESAKYFDPWTGGLISGVVCGAQDVGIGLIDMFFQLGSGKNLEGFLKIGKLIIEGGMTDSMNEAIYESAKEMNPFDEDKEAAKYQAFMEGYKAGYVIGQIVGTVLMIIATEAVGSALSPMLRSLTAVGRSAGISGIISELALSARLEALINAALKIPRVWGQFSICERALVIAVTGAATLVTVKYALPDLFNKWFERGWHAPVAMFLTVIIAGSLNLQTLGEIWDFDIVTAREMNALRAAYRTRFPSSGMTLDEHVLKIAGDSKYLGSVTTRTRIARILTSSDQSAWRIIQGIEKYRNIDGVQSIINNVDEFIEKGSSLDPIVAEIRVADSFSIEEIMCFQDSFIDRQRKIRSIDIVRKLPNGEIRNIEVKPGELKTMRKKLAEQIPEYINKYPNRKIDIYVPNDKVDMLKQRFGWDIQPGEKITYTYEGGGIDKILYEYTKNGNIGGIYGIP